MKFRIAPQIKVHYMYCVLNVVFSWEVFITITKLLNSNTTYFEIHFFYFDRSRQWVRSLFQPARLLCIDCPAFPTYGSIVLPVWKSKPLASIYWFIYTLMSQLISLWSNASVSNMTRNTRLAQLFPRLQTVR